MLIIYYKNQLRAIWFCYHRVQVITIDKLALFNEKISSYSQCEKRNFSKTKTLHSRGLQETIYCAIRIEDGGKECKDNIPTFILGARSGILEHQFTVTQP